MLAYLQRLGRSLMLPIAMLPAAALLVRLGADDVFDIPFISQAGSGILDNLAIIFAIGIAIGFSRDGNGAAALSGAAGYLVLKGGYEAINPDLDLGVLAGIIAGIAAGHLYNRFHDIKLPEFLAFFGGRRFVPIITALIMVVASGVIGLLWGPVQDAINALGDWFIGSGAAGVGSYGFFNRLLIPVGLHHVINALIWFDFGSFVDASGSTWNGEINRFLHGDPNAGFFMAGFFPIFMFGLPGACLAMYVTAKKHRKAAVGGFLASIAFTAFLTGITEPIEFSFMFLSPLLYVIHAVLTGLSLMVSYWLDIRHGFGFSAGFIDYLLNFGIAARPLLLAVQGLVFGLIYFLVFTFVIRKFDLKTPGREEDEEIDESSTVGSSAGGDYYDRAYYILNALGGIDNIDTLDYCATRLRLQIHDMNQVDENVLKKHGARGIMKMGGKNLQVIIGTTVEFLADAMRDRMTKNDMNPPVSQDTKIEQGDQTSDVFSQDDLVSPVKGTIMDITEVPDQVFSEKMMGDGFAIKPEDGLFVSPVDGEVISVFPTKHAIGIRTDQGIEILLHIGLDTVELKGEGFDVFVKDGDRVRKGERLAQVDLDYIEKHATSTITPVVFTNLAEGQQVHILKSGLVPSQAKNIIEVK